MKLPPLFLALAFSLASNALGVTVHGLITSNPPGAPAWSTIGSSLTMEFDLPDAATGSAFGDSFLFSHSFSVVMDLGGTVFPGPSALASAGFWRVGFGTGSPGPPGFHLLELTGGPYAPDASSSFYFRSFVLADSTQTALQNFNPVGDPLAEITPFAEAAAQARRFSGGALILLQNPGPTEKQWSYSFTVIPEPSAALCCAVGLLPLMARRRARPNA